MNEQMGLIGRKLGMTQIFGKDSEVIGVTVVESGPCTVLQVKTTEGKDGYNAIQLGFGTKKASRANQPEKGHLKAANRTENPPESISEIRLGADEVKGFTVGAELTPATFFKVGDKVDIIGTSKGRGFAGVFKRHHFQGFTRTHGVHEYFRHGGSLGTRLTPGHVMKGKRMPGHMGNERVTVQNVTVVRVDAERHLLFLQGGVPGPNGGFVTVRKAVKSVD